MTATLPAHVWFTYGKVILGGLRLCGLCLSILGVLPSPPRWSPHIAHRPRGIASGSGQHLSSTRLEQPCVNAHSLCHTLCHIPGVDKTAVEVKYSLLGPSPFFSCQRARGRVPDAEMKSQLVESDLQGRLTEAMVKLQSVAVGARYARESTNTIRQAPGNWLKLERFTPADPKPNKAHSPGLVQALTGGALGPSYATPMAALGQPSGVIPGTACQLVLVAPKCFV
jgi:hypothetical protein